MDPFGSYLPGDVMEPRGLGMLQDPAAKLPMKPKTRSERWDQARAAAFADPNNWQKWNELFRVLEAAWEDSASSESEQAVRAAVHDSYSVFLSRFPNSVQHWKQYSILQYKMAGMGESLACLKIAVSECPHSVSLWTDYLGALVASGEQTAEKSAVDLNDDQESRAAAEKHPKIDTDEPSRKEGKAKAQTEQIRSEFARAAKLIGMDFNSDPFWDKYISFERSASAEAPTSDGAASIHLLRLFLQLIRIPLYQYAQYYNAFVELCKSYSIDDIIEPSDLATYLAQYEKASSADLSAVEAHQIIEAFSYSIFTQTQQKVTELWPYESCLTLQEFSLAEIKAIGEQTQSWVEYLDHEIAFLASMEDGIYKSQQYKLVVSIFERALVPNCLSGSLWLKYLDFVAINSPFSAAESFDFQNDIFQRAIFKFVPLNQATIREKYVQFLMKEEQFEKANDFLLDTIRLFSGATGSKIYCKSAYVHDLQSLLELWRSAIVEKDVLLVLESLTTSYFDRIDRYKKENQSVPIEGNKDTSQKKFTLKPSSSTALSKLLNDDGICIASVQYLKSLRESPDNTAKIRKFYNKHHQERAFLRSVQFWRFFVEFEGYDHQNLHNLRHVINYIKTTTALPKMAIDCFLDIYYEITCANLVQAVSLSGKEDYLDILVNIGAEKSDDLFVNRSARSRLANNNYLLQPSKSNQVFDREELLMQMRAKHIANPGIFVEAGPEIVNSVMRQDWISLLEDDVKPPEMPKFKNLDKANSAISYPDE